MATCRGFRESGHDHRSDSFVPFLASSLRDWGGGRIVKVGYCPHPVTVLVSPLIMENQMEKKMENEMETGIM